MTDKEIIKANSLIEKLEDAYNAYYDTSRGMPYDLDKTLLKMQFDSDLLYEEHYIKRKIDNLLIETGVGDADG